MAFVGNFQDMQVDPMMTIRPYGVSRKDFLDYLKRLRNALVTTGLDEHQIGESSNGRATLNRYVHDNLMDPKSRLHREIAGEDVRFEYYVFDTDTGRRVFPVVNRMKLQRFVGYEVIGTYYFQMDHDEIRIGYVPMIEKSIIITS